MPTLFFPERDTLRLVLAGGGVNANVCRSSATAGFDEQGRLWLTTTAWLPRETLVVLTRYGVQVLGSSSTAGSESVSCWHELLPLVPVRPPEQWTGSVLFELPGHRFADLAGELERLGRHSYSFRWLHALEDDVEDDRVLLKTVEPPYSSMLRVLDDVQRGQDMSAYMEQAPNVWVEVGYRQPLAEQVQPPPGKLLFIRPPRCWHWQENQPFSNSIHTHDLESSQTLPLKSALPAHAASLPVPLRLLPTDNDAPAEMWLLRGEELPWLDRFVRSTDEHVLARFSFALTSAGDQPSLLLRVHGAKEPLPVLVGLPLGYRPLLKLANLYLPCGYRLAPMPRRDTLRELFASDVRRLTWLRPTKDGAFHTESLPLASFRAMKEWVDYRVEETQRRREPWRQSAMWEFERFAHELGTAPSPKAEEEAPKRHTEFPESAEKVEPPIPAKPLKRTLWKRALDWFRRPKNKEEEASSEAPSEEGSPIPIEETTRAASRLPQDRSIMPPAMVSEARERAKTLNSRFLSALEKLTPDDRLYLWPELAKAFADSNNPSEAAICWLNALWEQEKLTPSWVLGWLRAEAAQAGWHTIEVRLDEWLAAPKNAARARSLAAYAVWAALQDPLPPGFLASVNSLQAYIDATEAWLPVRAVWLARTALARLTRGDVLALARTRDRLFDRLLSNGLGLDLDTPAFVRFGESDDPDRFDLVRKWLMDKRNLIRKWIAQLGVEKANGTPERVAIEQFGLQGEVRCTLAYTDLMLSWALARLGEKVEGDRLLAQAWLVLDDADPIHAWLKSAFDYRIHQAREGKVSSGQLPADLLARLNRLSDDDRYRIDRLRQHSKILDSTERINAYWASTLRRYRHWDDMKRRLIELPGLEPAALNDRVKQLLAKTAGEASATLPAVLLDVLDVAPRLDKSLGEKVLEQVPIALDLVSGTPSMQLRLLEKALLAAASFDQPTKVQLLAHRFTTYIEDQRGLPASTMLEGLTGQTFRCLRRLGLKKEADQVLFQIHGWLTRGEAIPHLRKSRGNDWPSLMRTLLHVAAGWYYCGREEQGHAIIDEVRRDLYDSAMSLPERTSLAMTYAATLGQVPVRLALGRFEELFLRLKKVTVNGWNTHYTRQPLELVDTVLLAIVSEDFTLGPSVRGWLDDDEYLVRQRIHKELKELMEEQGV